MTLITAGILLKTMKPDWDEYFLGFAKSAALRADCTRRKVGAVIVNLDHRIVGTGYNGASAGRLGCLDGGCPRGLLSYDEVPPYSDYSTGPGRCVSNHAEVNAIIYAGRDRCLGGTIYSTEEPCYDCWKDILAAGLYRVVWPSGTLLVADKEL